MKTRIDSELNIRSARRLHKALVLRGLDIGCLPISVRALGGLVSFKSVINGDAEISKLSSLNKYNLETGGFIPIEEKVTPEYIENIFEILMLKNADGESKKIAGLLVLNYFPDNESYNHYFAVLPREAMRLRVKRSLTKKNQYKVVDSRGGRLVGKTSVKDFSDYFNEIIGLGGKFVVFQIYKR